MLFCLVKNAANFKGVVWSLQFNNLRLSTIWIVFISFYIKYYNLNNYGLLYLKGKSIKLTPQIKID